MPDTTTQRRAFDFLLDHFRSQEPFTKSAFHGVVPEWSASTLNTYWSKQIKRLLARADRNQFRVTEAFRPYANWDSFRKHIATQVRRIFSDYTSLIYDDLIIYEFFMPLTNEGPLRTALDALFYKDTILARLRTIGHEKVIERFPIQADDSLEAYLDPICRWIAEQFGGYSISHANGRFRDGPLATMAEVADLQDQRYI